MRFLLALLLMLPWLGHAAEADLLEPEKAFRLAARFARPDAIEVRYEIAPGYYMYRDKFRFALEPAAVKLGAPQLPPGKMKRDEFFGDVETYRNETRILLPFERDGNPVPALTLMAVSQGCADAGVCYTPQEQKVNLKLAQFIPPGGGAFVAAAPAAGGADGLIDVPGGRVRGEDALVAELFRAFLAAGGKLFRLRAAAVVHAVQVAHGADSFRHSRRPRPASHEDPWFPAVGTAGISPACSRWASCPR